MGLLAALVLPVVAVGPGLPAAAAGSIPVHDVFVIDVPVDEGRSGVRFEGVIHGAYRVPEGTVVYWSLRERPETDAGFAAVLDAEEVDLVGGVLADPSSLDVLVPLTADGRCLCTLAEDLPSGIDSHRFRTMYTTFPSIPAETAAIDIDVDGRGTIVVGVPVEGELPGGQQVAAQTAPMGAGWPAVPAEDVLAAASAQDAQDLVGRSSRTDGSVTTEGTGSSRLVRFDADVLFDFDRADLDDPAREVLDQAVAELEEAGSTAVEVVGHTDALGSAEYNMDLSLRRAQTVADVLTAALGDDVEVSVEGKGWNEPIATNDTEDGRAKNRRVTISHSTEGEDR